MFFGCQAKLLYNRTLVLFYKNFIKRLDNALHMRYNEDRNETGGDVMAIMKEENFPSIRVSQKLKDETIKAAEHEQENLSEYIRKAVERRNEQIIADSLKRGGQGRSLKMKKINKEVLTMTATEFATLNDIEVDEIQSYSDANVGAENLSPDTELKIIVRDGEIRVTRSDNPWNEPVDVVCGPAENWTYEK
jgi:hypothetical protein